MNQRGRRKEKSVGMAALSGDTLRSHYLSEREQTQTIRSQLAIPASIISFSTLALVRLAQELDLSRWREAATMGMTGFALIAVILVFAAMIYLGRVEWIFLRSGPHKAEEAAQGPDEASYFLHAIQHMRADNDAASRCRARALLLMLASLACLISAVALLPLY